MTQNVMDISPQERALLNGIRLRPGMYIGELSLSKIQAFLAGYQIALRNCGLEEQRCILPWEFHGFVTKRYGQPGPKGWCLSILEAAPDGKEAVEIFFSLLDEFLTENGYEKIGAAKAQEADDEA